MILGSVDPISHVVIYNLGVAGANAYATPAQNRAQISAVGVGTGGAAEQITLTAAFQFPFESPSHRFQVVGPSPVVCSCAGGQIRRSTPRALTAANMSLDTCPAAGVGDLLVSNVDCGGGYLLQLCAGKCHT